MRIKTAFQGGAMPMLAVDVPPNAFDMMIRNDLWLSDDDRDRDAALMTPSSSGFGIPASNVGGSSSAAHASGASPGAWPSWRSISAVFPPQLAGYSVQIREALRQRKTDGYKFMLLFSVKDERVRLLSLSS